MMIAKEIDREKASITMLIRWIDKLSYLNDKEKELVLKLAVKLSEDREEIIKLYNGIEYDKNYNLEYEGEIVTLSAEQKRDILSSIANFSEDILPIGTVVKLQDFILREENRDMKFIITSRFLVPKRNLNEKFYFTYGAVIYPNGNLDSSKLINFNFEGIKEIVHKGYSDKAEREFTLTMKNELVLKRNYKSMSFALREDIERIRQEM